MTAHPIRAARVSDTDEIAAMMTSLWPDGTVEEFRREVEALVASEMCGTLSATILVALEEDGSLSGFIQAGLRSHADGCDPAHPVGYVEGWFVRRAVRGRGIGSALMRTAEEWARSQGCLEMASDAVIENEESLRAHEARGFEVVDRCVHFRKRL